MGVARNWREPATAATRLAPMGAVRRSAALTADITMAACQVRAGDSVEEERRSPDAIERTSAATRSQKQVKLSRTFNTRGSALLSTPAKRHKES